MQAQIVLNERDASYLRMLLFGIQLAFSGDHVLKLRHQGLLQALDVNFFERNVGYRCSSDFLPYLIKKVKAICSSGWILFSHLQPIWRHMHATSAIPKSTSGPVGSDMKQRNKLYGNDTEKRKRENGF